MRLIFYLDSQNLLKIQLCGPRAYQSTLDHLVNLKHYISEALANRKFRVGVFLDIEKPYNMTLQAGPLKKLNGIGLQGNFPIFLQDFLTDSSFPVKLSNGNVISDTFVQECGIPQGSILAPTLSSLCLMTFYHQFPNDSDLNTSCLLMIELCGILNRTRVYPKVVCRKILTELMNGHSGGG